MDKYFIIAIGGTGMRCLESFVHLCAIGMFDNKEIDILTLDTDQANGNKGRVERLIDNYNNIKTCSDTKKGGIPKSDTFFSAKLNLHCFFTDYTTGKGNTFKALTSTQNLSQEDQDENKDLADLFLDKDTVQQFNLEHGYRAQTHLGSMLMYHGILDATREYAKNKDKAKTQDQNLANFIQKLVQAGEEAKVFVFGSVFGGTGASSIPIIPIALRDAGEILTNNTLDLKAVRFGSTLLTEYFTFTSVDKKQLDSDKIVASSDFFAINSQAALQFYQDDETVHTSYRMLYHIGWPLKHIKFDDNKEKGKVVTGGGEQQNDCHIVELLCACAAYDFFHIEDDKLPAQAEYLYRTIDFSSGTLDFKPSDFMEDDGEKFVRKLRNFFIFAHIILSKHGAANVKVDGIAPLLDFLVNKKYEEYIGYDNSINATQREEIDNYLRSFAYCLDNDGTIKRGWLYQIYNSVKSTGVSKFLFPAEVFNENWGELQKNDPCKIFQEKKSTGFFGSDGRKEYEDVIEELHQGNEEGDFKEKFIQTVCRAIDKTIQ